MPKSNLTRLTLALTQTIVFVSVAAARQPAASQAWAGWARCQIDVSGQGYSDQQTHTWRITGSTSKVTGALRVYPATWSVFGGGSMQRSEGTQILMAQWATTAQDLSAPLAVFVRASDKRMFIQASHAQMRPQRSINGYQQLTIDGKPKTPGKIASEAFEWLFPVVEVSRPRPGANLIANGSSTPVVNGKVGYLQPADAHATSSCTWQFGQGSDAPAPPPTVTAQAIPTPAAPGTAVPPPSGQPAGGAADCPSAPRNLVASVSGNTDSLQWSAPASGIPTAYVIQEGSSSGSTTLSIYTRSTALSFTGALPTGSWYLRVYAQSSCGSSAMSNEVLLVVP